MCFATPLMRQVAFMDTPSTRAESTCARLSALKQFMRVIIIML